MTPPTTHRARYSLLTVNLPGAPSAVAGVLLEDPATDQLHLRLRRDWDDLAPEESDVLSELESDLTNKARESGATALFDYLESSLSNVVQITDRRETIVGDGIDNFGRALGRLYRENVESKVHEYVTHLPRYSLAVAAGPFLENAEVESQGWEEMPSNLRLTKDMFVARIQGRSMEPSIPDGSLCVFRKGVTGSRQGRLVLVESLGGGTNDRYTVKRYESKKTQNPDGTWKHDEIWLHSLNPEFPSWQLNPEEDRYRILAEFVQVLD